MSIPLPMLCPTKVRPLIKRFLELWRSFSFPVQVGAALAVLLVLLMLISGTGAIISHYKDAKFDKEITAQKKERQMETDRANAAEKRAVLLEAEKQKYELVLEVAGERAKAASQKVTDAEKKFVTDSDHINGIADICNRYAELRASLHLAPKECPAAEASSDR